MLTLLPRFARDAVIPKLDHDSSPPFLPAVFSAKSKMSVSGVDALDVCLSV
jgi:hypothetical protein